MSLSMWQTLTATRMRKAAVAAAGTGAGAYTVAGGGEAVVIGGCRRAISMVNGRDLEGTEHFATMAELVLPVSARCWSPTFARATPSLLCFRIRVRLRPFAGLKLRDLGE